MSTLTVATVKSNSSDPPAFQNTSGTEIGRLCRAFVNFNSTGSIAIRAQYNVSSITDNGVGDYTVNFTTAMADANYSPLGSSSSEGNGYLAVVSFNVRSGASTTPSTGSIRMFTRASGTNTDTDFDYVSVAIFR